MSVPRVIARGSKWWTLLVVVLITLGWLYLWNFPWQAKLQNVYWFQLAIGLAIFIVPGFCIYALLSGRPQLEFNHITYGFVISHLVLAVLGTAGRFMNLSFELITSLMGTVGLMLIIVVFFKVPSIFDFQMNPERRAYLHSTVPFIVISLLVGLIVIKRVLSNDDLTHLAYITRWQHSVRLDFNDPVFGEPQLALARFWLMSAPFAEAFLAKMSTVPGILVIGGYYEPFLVILSVLGWYELAIALKFSARAASASVILQLSFLILFSEYLHPGAPFLNQLSVDKAMAAFIVAPVFFHSLIRLLEKQTQNSIMLVMLTGLSLMFMHAIILAYSVFIGGILILLSRNRRDFRSKVIPMITLIAILIPLVVIRFVKIPGVPSGTFDPEVVLSSRGSDDLIARWGNTRFYGFNPQILTMKVPYQENIPLPEPILEWGWILVPILAFIFALKQRETDASHFILACFTLSLLTVFPFTGWIFGYFLNGRMLARSVWLFPFGISSVYLLMIIRNKFWNRTDARSTQMLASAWPLITLTIFSTASVLLFMRENNLPNFEKFSHKSARYQGLASAGQALDQLITNQAATIGSQDLNDLLPGISWKARVITFRIDLASSMAYFTPEEKETRILDTEAIFSPSTSAEHQMDLLRKYNVRFLLLQRSDLRLFDDLITTYPSITASQIGGVYILQFH